MAISIADQIALDDALVAPADRLKIGKCNLRLSSDVTSKEATLQVVYDVLKLTPFYKAFQVTADAPEIYMQEFWASAYFEEPPLEKEILAFLASLGHSGDIRKIPLEKRSSSRESTTCIVQAALGEAFHCPRDDFVHPKLTTHDDDIIHEEETDEDDSFDPTIHTPSRISSSDDKDSDNEVEGANVEGAKSDEDATYEEDQGNEAVEDTNTDLDGRDDVMTDVILPQVQATQEIEDTHVTLTPVNPDGQQQSSSVSSGFVSNMLNPNQDTGVDDIFGQHTEATSLIDTPTTAIMEPSFTAQTNRPPTPYPLVIQTQQPPILTPATTTSSSLQNLPNFASLFGFDYRLKALEDNFSELRQTNQYAEALSSIPSIVDQYLANKMQEAVDVAVQLKYDRIREESTSANQQFLDSIDEGMKKIIKEQEANTSHAVAANLSELELKKILIDKMEANNSINRSDIQRQLYKALVEAYEADKILLDTYGDTVTIKRPRDGADDDQEPSAGTDRGSKRRRSGKEPASTSAPSETTTKTAGKTTSTGSKTHKKSASQSAPVEEAMQSTDVFKGPADQEFETGVHDEQAEEEVQHLPDWFQQPTRLPSPDHAWNKSVPAVHESVNAYRAKINC
ncbi:hypothetical protein Tco_1493200 [Tanacetum coccineum]